MATIFDENNKARRVLIARADLASNPYAKPILSSISSLTGSDDIGMLLDGDGRILVHPDQDQVMTTYLGRIPETQSFYDEKQPNGTRMLVYYQPTIGRDWAIVLMVPVYRAQQLALDIATPLLAMIVILAIIALAILSLGLRMVTGSMQNLAQEAGKIAQGRLDQPLAVDGVDEVGQLRRAFEQMRVSLKARLDELNRLLLVSQGVASSLDVSEAVQPVLEAALASGASSARVVLAPNVVPDLDGAPSIPISFGLGPTQNVYRDLDEQILALTRQQDRLVLSNLYRPRLLNFSPAASHPEVDHGSGITPRKPVLRHIVDCIRPAAFILRRRSALHGYTGRAGGAGGSQCAPVPDRRDRKAAPGIDPGFQPRPGPGDRPARPAGAGQSGCLAGAGTEHGRNRPWQTDRPGAQRARAG